jgi:hypothetical protein
MGEADLKPCLYCGIDVPATARKCRHCGEWLDEQERARRVAEADPGLTGVEAIWFCLLFLVVPLANIVIAHILYKMWAGTSLKKAKQVNALSFGCFVVQCVVAAIAVYALVTFWGGRR